jgi:hypothetical protein
VIARALGLSLIVSIACHRLPPADSTPAVERIVHGVISVTGTSFEQRLMLESGGGNLRLLPSSAADSAALVRLGGVDVSVRGSEEGTALRVRSFTAQRVSGQPVVDGTLRLEGDRIVLETSSGRLTLGNPPPAFRQMIGARVWVAGPLTTGPNTYGLIRQ